MDWSELSLFVGAVSASVASLILAAQKSKCSVIDCACVHCERAVDTADETTESAKTPQTQKQAPITLDELEKQLVQVGSK